MQDKTHILQNSKVYLSRDKILILSDKTLGQDKT